MFFVATQRREAMSEDNNNETITIPMFKNGVIPNFTYIDGHRYFREDALGKLKKAWSAAVLAELEREVEARMEFLKKREEATSYCVVERMFHNRRMELHNFLTLIRSKKGGA
jgi:hypothetical protein